MAHGAATDTGEWREGWPLAIAALGGMTIGSILIYMIGALIQPIEADLGWSRSQITFGLTISTLSGAVLAPLVGLMLDRWGPRRIALPGALLALGAISLLSLATSDYRFWLALWFCVSLGMIGVKPTVWAMSIASSFDKVRGLAMAVALCGSSLAALTMPILVTWLADTQGWRDAIWMTCVIVGIIIWPVLFWGLRTRADRNAARGGTATASAAPATGVLSVRRAVLSPQFVKLAGAAFLFTLGGIGLVTNMVPVISSLDFTRTQAAGIAGLIGLASLIGRLTTGFLIDRFDSNLVAGTLVAFPMLSCLILLNVEGDILLASLAVFMLGLSLGAEVDVIAYLAAEKFGTARYGTIFGFMTSSWYLATAAGPVLVSLVYDVSGNYDLALKVAIPLFALVSLLLYTLGRPLPFDEVVEA